LFSIFMHTFISWNDTAQSCSAHLFSQLTDHNLFFREHI
jgi:hypothetical protein